VGRFCIHLAPLLETSIFQNAESTSSHKDFTVGDSPVHTLIEKLVDHFVLGSSLPRLKKSVEGEHIIIYVISFEMDLKSQEEADIISLP